MPIVAKDGKEPNDGYVEQLVSSAQAAVDYLVKRGVGDRARMAVGYQCCHQLAEEAPRLVRRAGGQRDVDVQALRTGGLRHRWRARSGQYRASNG